MESNIPYPPSPAHVPPGFAEPSPAFRAEVRNVVIAIAAFAVVYLLMVALALALTWLCLRAGLFVIALRPGLWTLLIGGGVMFMGGLVVFFLIKFLFAASGGNDENGVALQESDEPQLFGFIRRVAGEVGTHFPKKILLIPDVNASVFYSSSFWSLFFPTRKNLNIGIGLVNSLNVSELKAVLAHEFGHFSQKSMSLGSYVYYVNQVIFNMLYRNDGWAATADSVAGIHAVLSFFVHLAVYIVQGIQWVLRGMYGIVNRQYLSLSREMEFHADAIAAGVSGSNNMAQALRQVTMGSIAYQRAIEKCNEILADDAAPVNFYAGQRAVAASYAATNDLPLRQGLPLVTREFMARRSRERVVFKDQWASHPTQAEREAKLQDLNLEAPVLDMPAWTLFRDPAHWQNELTQYLYRAVDKKLQPIDGEDFAKSIVDEDNTRRLPKMFNGYFDEHFVAEADLDAIERDTAPLPLPAGAVQELFGENLTEKIGALQNDMATLEAIAEGKIDTKTFDFDGQKYGREQADGIRRQLETETAAVEAERDRRDREAVRLFYAHLSAQKPGEAPALLAAWRALYEARRLKMEFDATAQEIFITVHFLRLNEFNVAVDMAQRFRELHAKHEPALRDFFKKIPDLDIFPEQLRAKIRATFLGEALQYHHHEQPHQTNLEKLQMLVAEIGQALGDLYFVRLKAVLKRLESEFSKNERLSVR